MTKIALILLLLVSVNLFAFDAEKFTSKISEAVDVNLYNVEPQAVREYTELIVEKNKEYVQAFQLIDSIDGSIIYQAYKSDNVLILDKEIPSALKKYKHISKMVTFEGEYVGKIVLYYSDSSLKINLTQEEENWIKNNPLITVGGEMDWAPFDFVDETGNYTGLAKDYLEEIGEITGLKFKYETGKTWEELLLSLKSGTIDILPAIYINEERKKNINFTTSYLSLSEYIFTRSDYPKIKDLNELKNKTIAVVKGFDIKGWLEKNHRGIKIIEKATILDCLRSVQSKESDIFIGDDPSTTYSIEQNLLLNLKINTAIKGRKPIKVYMATKKEYKILADIITKSLKAMSRNQKTKIASHWMSLFDKNKISLTEKEHVWLDKKETISYVYDPDWAPFEWTNELDQHTGIISDVLQLISASSGIEFKAIPTPKWSDSIKMMTDDKADMYSAVAITDKRKKYVNFTSKNIYSSPGVIVTKSSDETLYLDIKSALETKNVGLANGYAISDYVEKTYPDLKFTMVDSVQDGFQKLENNDIDLFILNAATAQYYIKQKGFSDLRIATKIDFTFDLKIALQKELPPEVLSILDKAIDSISDKELGDIYHKWTSIKVQTKTDWDLIFKIMGIVFILFIIGLYWNRKLKFLVEEKTKDMAILLDEFDENIIASKTDLKGRITHVSKAFCEICQYTENELMGKPHNIIRHPDVPKEAFADLWKTIQAGETWKGEVKNLKKDGGFYWVHATVFPEYDKSGNIKGYSAIRHDITAQKEVEDLTANLEAKVAAQTKDLKRQLRVVKMAERKQEELLIVVEEQKEFTQTLLDSQEQLIITTDGKTLLSANKTFYDFFAVDTVKDFIESYDSNCICNTFNKKAPEGYLQINMGTETWIDYVINRPNNTTHKAMISMGRVDFIFSVTAAKLPGNDGIRSAVFTNITEMENAKNEIEAIHKHTRESIEYASLIQGAVVSQEEEIKPFFKDSFVHWEPKDTVGGDIWLFNELRHEDECLLFFIDCTGHGVPGAFVTMIVKAIEREVVAKIKADRYNDIDVSPAWIMAYFNKTTKKLLKQETKDAKSNAGWDGGVIYYNRRTQILKFAGAETPLFYTEKDGEFKTVKGNRYSVGYKKCDPEYAYKETIINVEEGMKFYCTTDGYIDQNGGEKDFPFGKKKFGNIIKENHTEPMNKLKDIFIDEMDKYESMVEDNDRNDDITLIAFEIDTLSNLREETTEEIIKYEGLITQNAIASAIDNIESKITNIGIVGIISTITIEYCQNMMHYSKDKKVGSREIVPQGQIEVQYINDEYYQISATNIVAIEDKEKIELKLKEIQSLDKEGIKKRYRELRKSGKNTHEKGGGIGIYEIAKISDSLEYNFKAINELHTINEDKFYFTMSVSVKPKKKKVEE